MATQQVDTKFRIRAIDKMSRVLNKVKGKFGPLNKAVSKTAQRFRVLKHRTRGFTMGLSKMGAKMKSIGRSASIGLTAPIGLAFGGAIRAGLSYQKAINEVGAVTQTVVDGKISQSFQNLDTEAKKLGRSTAFSASQVANAMTELARKGFDATEILSSTKPILDLAVATNFDLAESANIVSDSLRAFGLDAGQTVRVTDLFAKATASSGISMESLGETFKAVAPIANAYGSTIDEAVAITGLLGNVGIRGSNAGTALKNMFLKLAAPGSKATQMMKALEISVSNADGSMRGIGDIVTELGPKLSKLPKAGQMQVLNELFGLRGIAGGAALMADAMKSGKDPVAAFTQVIKNSEGVTQDMVKTMRQGGVGSMQDFKSALEGAGIAFAQSGVLDGLAMLARGATKLLQGFAALPKPIRLTIAVVLGLVAVIGPLLIMFGFMAQAIAVLTPFVLAAIPAIAGFAAGVWAAVAPILLIVAKLALFVVAIKLAFKFGQILGMLLTDLFTKPAEALDNFITRIKSLASLKSILNLVSFGFLGKKNSLDVSKKVSLEPQGNLAGSENLNKSQANKEFLTRTNNAKVDVNIRAPENTGVVSQSEGAFMNLKTGPVGAF